MVLQVREKVVYKVRIENTPYCFAVEPGESVLQAALRENVDMPWGCGDGLCGVCMGQVVSGKITYPNGPPMALFEDCLLYTSPSPRDS